MKKIKKLFSFVLFLIMLLSLFACGEYKPAANKGDSQNGLGGSLGGKPSLDGDKTNDFTVSLRLNGEPYVPTISINAYWNDGFSIHVAPFDEKGVATIDGLDGDYDVTLSTVPTGYAYDPNIYKATNDQKHIVIDMYDLNAVNGKGTSLYSCINLKDTGVYTVTITEPGESVYFEYAPRYNGTYTIESWASIVEDEISPIAIAYFGTAAYKHSPYTVDEVGTVGSFTRNFIHTVEIADEMISTSGGGQQTFTFALTAEAKSGVYPVSFTFAIKRNGGFDLEKAERTMVPVKADMSKFDFGSFNSLAGGKLVGAETLIPGTTDSYMFDQDNFKLWKISEGGDGVYHVFDPDKYPETGGYGPVLVAYISAPCRFVDSAFTNIESFGNKALTVNGGTQNYKQFIEGFAAVASGGFYCLNDCPCHPEPSGPKACEPGCPNCKTNCTPCPSDLMNKPGYNAWCNADGVAPVTEELADFLQKFAISQRYFADGDGWVEDNNFLTVDAYEDSQWLFACAYYED